jgi:uncharacterized damage-inducible protein DinB
MQQPPIGPDYAAQMARYNRAANARLYAACAELSDAERRGDLGLFFTSVHGTLNHLMLGDRIWLARFRGEAVASTGLDAILYDDFEALRAARIALDDDLAGFMESVTPAFLTSTVRYRNNAGRDLADPVWILVVHLFNHQTHHRGQLHAALTRLTGTAPSFDLHRVLNP